MDRFEELLAIILRQTATLEKCIEGTMRYMFRSDVSEEDKKLCSELLLYLSTGGSIEVDKEGN